MNEVVHPYRIEGVLQAVASKSYLQRALAIAGLADGPTFIRNYNASADAIAAQNIITKLGSKVRGGVRMHIVPGKPDFSSDIMLDADGSDCLCANRHRKNRSISASDHQQHHYFGTKPPHQMHGD